MAHHIHSQDEMQEYTPAALGKKMLTVMLETIALFLVGFLIELVIII